MTCQNIPGMLLSGIAVTFHCLQHWCQCWGSSLQDCITNTLLTEPSPALLCFAGCKINSQLLDANKGALSTVSHLFHEKESASHIANVWDLQPTEKPSALKSCAWRVYLRWLHFLDPSGVISTSWLPVLRKQSLSSPDQGVTMGSAWNSAAYFNMINMKDQFLKRVKGMSCLGYLLLFFKENTI